MALEELTALPCGRDPLEVVDADLEGTGDAHAQTCPYCRKAIADARGQQTIADDLRSSATPAPSSLLPSVMTTVWSELRPGKQLPLPSVGAAFVTELAVSSALQHDLDLLQDLEIQVCRARLHDREDDPVPPPVSAPLVHVDITAAAAYPADLLALADTVRSTAARTLLVQFGLAAVAIDVDIVDLYDSSELT